MPAIRLILNPMRTAQQGVNVNVGKDGDAYKAITTTLSMHPQDIAALGVESGDAVLVRTEFGEAEFKCESAKVPLGLAFVPYGPPTCQLMGGGTDGTGMPTSKGWEADVLPISSPRGTTLTHDS
jgi:formylmethanofuran dehydrogenase subunit D